jgi:hypothetical protein
MLMLARGTSSDASYSEDDFGNGCGHRSDAGKIPRGISNTEQQIDI